MFAADTIDSVSKKQFVVSANCQYGFILVHRSNIQHFSQTHFSVIQATILKQTNGGKVWHTLYNLPRVGINLLYTNFAGNTLLKQAYGAQAFIDFSKKIYNKNSFHFKMGCGLGYIQTPFQRETNFKNNAIGTHINGLVQLGGYYRLRLAKRVHANMGVSIIHFSNGAYKTPNLGLNIVSAGIALQFHTEQFKENRIEKLKDTVAHKKHVALTLGIGLKQNFANYSSNFGVSAVRLQYHFRNTLKHSISAGVDVFNDTGIRSKLLEQNSINREKTIAQLGLNVQYEQVIGRVSIPIFMGAYFYSNYKGNGLLYHGLGVKYRITSKISAALILKTHFARADYFLCSIGYRL